MTKLRLTSNQPITNCHIISPQNLPRGNEFPLSICTCFICSYPIRTSLRLHYRPIASIQPTSPFLAQRTSAPVPLWHVNILCFHSLLWESILVGAPSHLILFSSSFIINFILPSPPHHLPPPPFHTLASCQSSSRALLLWSPWLWSRWSLSRPSRPMPLTRPARPTAPSSVSVSPHFCHHLTRAIKPFLSYHGVPGKQIAIHTKIERINAPDNHLFFFRGEPPRQTQQRFRRDYLHKQRSRGRKQWRDLTIKKQKVFLHFSTRDQEGPQ